MTSCGKVVCESCAPGLRQSSCSSCNGPCTRTVPLSRSAPKEVLDLFADPVEKLKEVFKIMSFHANQKSGLLNGKREVKRKHQEKKEKRLNQLQEINKALSHKQDAFKEYKHQEQKYREELNRLTIGQDD